MKILLLSTNDILGGAAMVTYRLMQALRHEGADARMLVANRQTDSQYVATVGQTRLKAAFVAERGEIFINNGLSLNDLWKVSTARFGADICAHPWVREADIIVLNWINQGFLSLGQLKRLCTMGKPVVWVMHDLWCATGICHLPGECRRFTQECGHCGLLHWEKGSHDLSHRVWKKKKRLFDGLGIRFVAVSRWQCDQARESSLIGNASIEVIPHAFPVEEYHTSPRSDFHSPRLAPISGSENRRLITMGAARLDDPIKDLPMAIESLNLLADSYPDEAATAMAVFFGQVKNPDAFAALRLPFVHAGMLTPEELRQLYSASTVVLSTSRFETMGATLMEGMASGATPVTFGCGGQPDIVTHGENGYIADYGSPESVAECIVRAIRNPFSRQAQHDSVVTRFSSGTIARRYLSLFAEMLSTPRV